MKVQRGFSLIELLIVVVIILIIAAIAIPNLLRAKISANEASAITSVRTITTAEVTYASNWGQGYAASLANLGGTTPCNASAATACLLDPILSVAPFSKSGYAFQAVGANLSNGALITFETTASPVAADVTGKRSFCADQTGVLRYNTSGAAIGTGPGSCLAAATVLVGN